MGKTDELNMNSERLPEMLKQHWEKLVLEAINPFEVFDAYVKIAELNIDSENLPERLEKHVEELVLQTKDARVVSDAILKAAELNINSDKLKQHLVTLREVISPDGMTFAGKRVN